jgi:hypothetical protein
MKTVLASVLICGFFASLAVAEDGSTAAGDDQPGPIALTEVEMDQVTAGATGTVKWFNATKGYGFIQPAEAGDYEFLMPVEDLWR